MERSKDWIFQAQGDLDLGRLALKHGSYDWTCFAAQQAAEKSVKAVLSRLGAEAWGYSVKELLDGLAPTVGVPSELANAGAELDKGYITSRYPDALPSGAPRSLYTQPEAERMIDHAEGIVQFCADYLAGLPS